MQNNDQLTATAAAMRAMGFIAMPAEAAKEKYPGVTAGGDDVWVHVWRPNLWVQGLPDGKALVQHIYHQGYSDGSLELQKTIREALGIK